MNNKSVHEAEAEVMSAAEVWNDAQQLGQVLRQNLVQTEPVVRLQIPLSVFLAAVDDFSQDELLLLKQRVQDRLAA